MLLKLFYLLTVYGKIYCINSTLLALIKKTTALLFIIPNNLRLNNSLVFDGIRTVFGNLSMRNGVKNLLLLFISIYSQQVDL